MAYERKDWQTGEVITEAGLDNIEAGINENKQAISQLDTDLDSKVDVSAIADMLTKTEAAEMYASKEELEAKADTATLTNYLQKTEATETYASKEELGNKADTSAIADMLTKTEAGTTYAKKGTQISSEDATDDASSETVDPTEFTKVVTLLNEIKTALNTMNGFGA